jgi:hypothetical protein
VLHVGAATQEQLLSLIGPSAFGAEFENPLTGQTDGRMEGIYLRIEADGMATGRAKMVRPEFVEKIKLSEHWQRKRQAGHLLRG